MPSSHSRSDGKTVSVCLVYPDLRRAIHAEPPRRAAAVGPDCRAGGALLGMSTLRVQGLSIQAIGRLRNAQNLADGMPLFRSVSRSLPPHAPWTTARRFGSQALHLRPKPRRRERERSPVHADDVIVPTRVAWSHAPPNAVRPRHLTSAVQATRGVIELDAKVGWPDLGR